MKYKIGDKVKVVKKVNISGKSPYWASSRMDLAIGQEGKIINIETHIYDLLCYQIEGIGSNHYYLPESIELANPFKILDIYEI